MTWHPDRRVPADGPLQRMAARAVSGNDRIVSDNSAVREGRVVYVSPDGDDALDGLTPSRAKRTITAGWAAVRHGHPDWLMLLPAAHGETIFEVQCDSA
jgi:hypothetical protein